MFEIVIKLSFLCIQATKSALSCSLLNVIDNVGKHALGNLGQLFKFL